MLDVQPIATVSSYDELHAALRARADELGVSRLVLDEQAGVPSGYTAKVLGPAKIKMPGRKTLGPILGALCCRLVLVENAEARAEFEKRSPPKRNERQVRHRKEKAA